MKLTAQRAHAALGLALVIFAPACEATAAHRRIHNLFEKKHTHLHVRQPEHDETQSRAADPSLLKRSTCAFPADADPNLVAITPDSTNGGWAMSPDQSCDTDSYCPYACKPGMVMAQWDPDSSFTYPASMNGGLYCNSNGEVEKPFEDKPYCVDGTGAVKAVNKAGKSMSWCQTVLPGNEAMLIPTVVSSSAVIAVPDTSYWCETAAHFYINPPGTGEEGCVWGDESQPIGNWSPFVAGANTDSNGQTFVKVGWNPIWEGSSLTGSAPEWGLRVECPDGGCTGLPCEIGQGGSVISSEAATGAGGSSFCVVTVSKGSTANIVAFGPGGGDGGGDEEEAPSSSVAPPPSTSEEPTTTSETPTPTPTPTPTSTSTSTTPTSTSTTSTTPSSTSTSTSTSSAVTTSHTVRPGIFHENGNSTSSSHTTYYTPTTSVSDEPSETTDEPAETTSDENIAGRKSGSPAFVGLLIAFVATAYLL